MKNILYLTIILFGIQIVSAQTASQYTVKALREDFAQLRNHLENTNPITYLYQSKPVITSYLDSIEQEINQPMTEIAFYRLISPLAALIKDGHNLIMPSAQVISFIDQHPHTLPLQTVFINKEIFIVANYSENKQLKPQSKIQTINNVPIASIIKRLYETIPREGLQTQLTDSYINKWFRYFYHLHYGYTEKYIIQYADPNGVLHTASIKGLSLDEIMNKKKLIIEDDEQNKGIFIKIVDSISNTAILNIPSFAPTILKDKYQQNKFRRAIDKCFLTIFQQNIKHLIIDIRENGGGNPMYSVYLLKYLLSKPFIPAIEGRVVNQPQQTKFLVRTKKKWYPWYGIGKFKPKKKYYPGEIYLLIGGGTFSAAVEFGSTLKKYNRATFIGQETGGNPIIMTGNYLREERQLKNTQITHYSGNICTIYNDLKLNDGRGIIPDYPVKTTIENVMLKEDIYLKKALSIIKIRQQLLGRAK